jgi:hypothetical protein
MTNSACEFESGVAAATQSGVWTDALRRHVAQCRDCQETKAVTSFMRRVGDACSSGGAVPDPRLIRLRAEVARRTEIETRALRSQSLSFAFALLSLVLTALVVVRWAMPAIHVLGNAALATGIALALVMPLVCPGSLTALYSC